MSSDMSKSNILPTVQFHKMIYMCICKASLREAMETRLLWCKVLGGEGGEEQNKNHAKKLHKAEVKTRHEYPRHSCRVNSCTVGLTNCTRLIMAPWQQL